MIAILDYGMGNLRNVQKALEFIGQKAYITEEPAGLARAERLILPGVGAFRQASQRLRQTGLGAAFAAAVQQGRPALGICLGMQLLFEESDEFGVHQGLGLIPGRITRIRSGGQKIPHMGWNAIAARGESPLLAGLDGSYFYFVHSLCMQQADADCVTGVCNYGEDFGALVRLGNLHGAQFHPEKSGDAGLELLRHFAAI